MCAYFNYRIKHKINTHGISKKTTTKGSQTVVTFKIEAHEASNSSEVLLLGDFNNWQQNNSSNEMEKEGSFFTKSLKLENGKCYEFRYLGKETGWFNDGAADSYFPSPYQGIDNCVVDLSDIPAAKKTVKKTKKGKKDDLKKIEGIGPKIAAILTEKGIETFEKLSKASVSILEDILKEAGPRYSIHKPGSWPKQAKLAFKDKWEELKKLQSELNGGK
ncbi:helix-hairpin-helix domain-containing protein [Aquimarina agarivorans]|uniref:helix-hairpin-helix domain-containing protein n=1 Tax=Aquimarina agarivorans TaxID=980584 RepID=UPI000248E724|nr:helix-hairpin-helix domain-containing protein [Aquimarina agarivorans]